MYPMSPKETAKVRMGTHASEESMVARGRLPVRVYLTLKEWAGPARLAEGQEGSRSDFARRKLAAALDKFEMKQADIRNKPKI